ncbi:unnamed protein product, partial [Prorocentrum cordatum]
MALFPRLAWSVYVWPLQLTTLELECLCAPSREAPYPGPGDVPSDVMLRATIELDRAGWEPFRPMREAAEQTSPGRPSWVFINPRLAATVREVSQGLGFNHVACQARRRWAGADAAIRERALGE